MSWWTSEGSSREISVLGFTCTTALCWWCLSPRQKKRSWRCPLPYIAEAEWHVESDGIRWNMLMFPTVKCLF